MPSAVVEYRKGMGKITRFFDTLLRSRSRVMNYEKNAIQHSDIVLVVVDEAKSRLERDYADFSYKINVIRMPDMS